MFISAARLKRELLTKNGLNMSVWIKIFLVLRRNSLSVDPLCGIIDT